MASMLQDFVLQNANAPGTAASVQLLSTVTGRRAWLSAFSTGSVAYYFMDDGTQAEWGYGTLTSGSPDTLSRDTVIGNTAGTTSRLNFTGAVRVFCSLPAEKWVYLDNNGTATAPGGFTATGYDSGGFHIRAASTNYGVGLRNDDTSAYLLQTASGSPSGSFNTFRPYAWNLSTGAVTIDATGAGAAFGGNVDVAGGSVAVHSSTVNPALTVSNTASGGRPWSFIADTSGNAVIYDGTAGLGRLTIDTVGRVIISGGGSYSFSGAGVFGTGGASTGQTSSTTASLIVANSTVSSNFIAVSDAELKSGVQAISPEAGLAFVRSVDPKTYVKHAEADHSDPGSVEAGFIAQDLLAAGYAHMVGAMEDGRFKKGHRLLAIYDQAIAYHQAALRAAIAQIDALSVRVAELECTG